MRIYLPLSQNSTIRALFQLQACTMNTLRVHSKTGAGPASVLLETVFGSSNCQRNWELLSGSDITANTSGGWPTGELPQDGQALRTATSSSTGLRRKFHDNEWSFPSGQCG